MNIKETHLYTLTRESDAKSRVSNKTLRFLSSFLICLCDEGPLGAKLL